MFLIAKYVLINCQHPFSAPTILGDDRWELGFWVGRVFKIEQFFLGMLPYGLLKESEKVNVIANIFVLPQAKIVGFPLGALETLLKVSLFFPYTLLIKKDFL